ncbi:hypothetical protein SE15_01525 [Thermanaerothrix daxensis]|uniref:Uncharacterized protein n=1 Tax=Thermanaerothrix daxensis TaxID=869279 RepID=A0A0N8GQK1_9CHLR|nr:hypothetical protein [Thermanaerothrix daxensis]KPL83922.1 hypothetical protein SE15_01525 [Thermanaerothrix daxensis]
MLDDLRSSIDFSFSEEEEPTPPSTRRRRRRGQFLGMTAAQRFVLSLLLFLMTVVLGMLCLVVTGRMMLF